MLVFAYSTKRRSITVWLTKVHMHTHHSYSHIHRHSFENPRKEFCQALVDHLHYIKEERQNNKKKHLSSLSHPPPPPSSAKTINHDPLLLNKQANTTVKGENRETNLQQASQPPPLPLPPAIAPAPVRINRCVYVCVYVYTTGSLGCVFYK